MPSLSSYYTYLGINKVDANLHPAALAFPVLTDLNGDGKADFIVLGASYPGGAAGNTAQSGGVYFGDGQGGFTKASSAIFPDTLATVHPRKVLVADFNGDGRPDIFVSSHGWDTDPFPGEQNRLYLSQADGSWKDATASLPQLLDYSHTAAVGDIDQNGSLDIFVGNGYAGQNGITSYMLMNAGAGQFSLSRAALPGAGGVLDFNSGHSFPGATLTDLDGDKYPELIITADASASFNANRQTTILWNHGGLYSQSDATVLPATTYLANQLVMDVQSVDINGDGLPDLIAGGTQGQPFYDGSFVQVLLNRGNHQFEDVTASVMPASDISHGSYGQATGAPWIMWVHTLDFNNDGYADFSVEYNGQLSQSLPLVWLNDGTGHFSTLKVSDFVSAGNEWQLGTGLLTRTDQGYSFIVGQDYSGSGGLLVTGLLASQPYLATPASSGPLTGGAGNDILRGTTANDTIDGGAGIDEVLYLGNAGDFTITKSGNGYTVADQRGVHDQDSLINVERLKFNDTSIALDIDGNAGQAYRIYQAAFNRTPDAGGLSFWLHARDLGVSLNDIAAAFVGSAEFKTLYGAAPSNAELVTRFYDNVLHRQPEQGGYDFWLGILDSKAATPAQVLAAFSEGAENQAAMVKIIGNGFAYTPYAG